MQIDCEVFETKILLENFPVATLWILHAMIIETKAILEGEIIAAIDADLYGNFAVTKKMNQLEFIIQNEGIVKEALDAGLSDIYSYGPTIPVCLN